MSMRLHVSHPSDPDARINGFITLWAYYIKGFDPSRHCQFCFKGKLAPNFNTRTAECKSNMILEHAADFPFVYICGVAKGLKSNRRENNLHLPLRYAAGRNVERTTYNGYRFVIENAEQLEIPALPDGWNGLPSEHTRCKNFCFGVAHLAHSVIDPIAQRSDIGAS